MNIVKLIVVVCLVTLNLSMQVYAKDQSPSSCSALDTENKYRIVELAAQDRVQDFNEGMRSMGIPIHGKIGAYIGPQGTFKKDKIYDGGVFDEIYSRSPGGSVERIMNVEVSNYKEHCNWFDIFIKYVNGRKAIVTIKCPINTAINDLEQCDFD